MYDSIVAKALRESYPTGMITSIKAYTRGYITTVDVEMLLPLKVTIEIAENELVKVVEQDGSVAI